MTIQEARTIAALRLHFGCSFDKLAGLSRAIWGEDYCREMTGGKHGRGSLLGRDLLNKMEETLGLERCESDTMTMTELVCLKCQNTRWFITPKRDVEKECDNCGEMAMVFPSGA